MDEVVSCPNIGWKIVVVTIGEKICKQNMDYAKANLHVKTVRNIAIAWLITLPVTIIMAGMLFLLLRMILG